MDNKKRMMFSIDEDYYFISIKILIILGELKCYTTKLVDYRKLALIIEFIKNKENFELFKELFLNDKKETIQKNKQILNIYFNASLNEPLIKKIILFLERKGLLELEKHNKFKSLDVKFIKNRKLENFLSELIFDEDRERIVYIKNNLDRVKSIKYDTFIEKIFGSGEVSKWDI